MAKPTNAIKGFIRLTHQNSKQFLVNIANIATVRSTGENTFVFLLRSPFVTGGDSQEVYVLEPYEEVVKHIAEATK